MIDVREATESDLPLVLACLHAAFAPFEWHFTPTAYKVTILTPARLRHRTRLKSVLVADCCSVLAGTVYLEIDQDRGHLRSLAVLPGWTRRGVGTSLLRAAEQRLRDQGCQIATSHVAAPMRPGMRFFERQGYSPSGRIEDLFGVPSREYTKRL